jgi:Xaa-Pro aminopeptidase
MFLVLSLTREPIAIIPTGSLVVMRLTSWVTDIRTWPAPQPDDDGVSLVADALRAAAGSGGRIGAEFGPETHIRLPTNDFLKLRTLIEPLTFTDASALLQRLRMIKSPAEVARIRTAAQLVSRAFEDLPAQARIGDSERDICLRLQIDVLTRGADRFPYMIACSGPDGYETINTDPSDRPLDEGDVLIIDTGCTVDSYFCDFDRNFAFGKPGVAVREAHARAYEATDAGIAAAKVGARTSDVWQAMADTLGRKAISEAGVGRMGHGFGLNLTEPPSIHPDDDTIIMPGMVLAIEPGIGFNARDGSPRVMVHEENILIGEHGPELLSRRAPRDLPEIGA